MSEEQYSKATMKKSNRILFILINTLLLMTLFSGFFALVTPWDHYIYYHDYLYLEPNAGHLECTGVLEPDTSGSVCLRVYGPVEYPGTIRVGINTKHAASETNLVPSLFREITIQPDDFTTCWNINQQFFFDLGAEKASSVVFLVFIPTRTSPYGDALAASCSIYLDTPLVGNLTKEKINIAAWILLGVDLIACFVIFIFSGLRSGIPLLKWIAQYIRHNLWLFALLVLLFICLCAILGPVPLYTKIPWLVGWIGLILTTLLTCALAVRVVRKYKKERQQSRGESEAG